CGDAEADETTLAIFRFSTEQRIAGKTSDEIHAAVDSGLASGRFRAPQRPALVYMVSSSQVLGTKTQSHFMPHLMIFYPGMSAKAMGVVESKSMDVPGVASDGKPTSALIVVVRDWVDPNKVLSATTP
ncbi:MAG TPA: hypothetical protein VNV25_23905, partial [Gemmatimonadaceae bacterium]|nr:hypothetical protein [Gemmatimonadaceae bacterium]